MDTPKADKANASWGESESVPGSACAGLGWAGGGGAVARLELTKGL